jgi:hypothetical protein
VISDQKLLEDKELINHKYGQNSRVFFETTFLLFFLSLDLGQNLFSFGFDTAFLGLTVLAVAVLPFYLPSADDVGISEWLTGRGAISVFGIVCGVVFGQLIGGVLPEMLSGLPLIMASVSGFAACVVMFAGFFNLSYAE